ncbi:MAG: DUF1127 domain-containing protein [Reyranellales bacterium]
MMTQPIQMFENLTSETAPAGGNALTKLGFSFEDRRLIERQARYARAALVADSLTDGLLWVVRQYRRLTAAIKADFKLRAAEAQLFRMSDRELADLGLCRAEIHFAVREAHVEGVTPQIDTHHAAEAAAANRNASPAIFWAGRA